MTNFFDEIILSRAELVYCLYTLGAREVVGMELGEFDLPQPQLDALLREGEQRLIARSLLVDDVQAQTRQISPDLLEMVRALAFRPIAFILVRGLKGYGQQLFVMNFHEGKIVEHTLPEEGKHRLMLMSSLKDLFARLDRLVPLEAVIQEGRPEVIIAQDEFEALRVLADSGSQDEAITKLTALGFPEDMAHQMLQALANPQFTLSLACLKIEDKTIVEAFSVAIFADEMSSWGIWPAAMESDPPQLLIRPSGINDIWSVFLKWLDEVTTI